MVDNECDLKKELSKNKMFRNDLKNFVGSVTPYVPYIGLISGLITVGGFIVYKKFKTPEDAQQPNEVRTERSEAPKEPKQPRKTKVPKEDKVQPKETKEPKQPPEAPNEVRKKLFHL